MPGRRRFSVLWARSAASDLDSIIDYLAPQSGDEAERVLGKIQKAAYRLASFPRRGRVVPELKEQGITLYHEIVRPPWRIVYRIEASAVLIMAVVDARRNLEDLLLQRFLR